MFPDKSPGIITRIVVVMTLISFIPLAYISVLRVLPSKAPRLSIIPDMDKQQKYLPQSHNAMFADGRGMRYYPAGTVARGEADLDQHLYQGIVNGQWAVDFPMEVSPAMMDRGHRQYNIYCSPCHGYSGFGDGMVAKRADDLSNAGTPGMSWVPPKSLQDKDTVARPVGHIFNTITNGIRTMPPYKGQISVEDRWAIILYVRALQRSQNASLSEVPANERATLEAGRAAAIQAEQDAAAKKAAEAAAEAAKAGTPQSGTSAEGQEGSPAPPPSVPGEEATPGQRDAEGMPAAPPNDQKTQEDNKDDKAQDGSGEAKEAGK